jgi:hypothetical protein
MEGCPVVVDVNMSDACAIDIPAAPENTFIDPDSARLFYFAVGLEPATVFHRPSDCTTGVMTFDSDNKEKLVLCDSLCAKVRADPQARVMVWFDCVLPCG